MENKKPKKWIGFKGSSKNIIESSPTDDSVQIVKKTSETKTFKKVNQIPDSIAQNPELLEAIQLLPSNYNFEILKTIWRVQEKKAKRVALQFPEGLLVYSCLISDILERFCSVETVIMGDVTYGACCVDDFSAAALGCDFMVHYGHSCLVPIDRCQVNVLYVFVDIKFDVEHFVESIKQNFAPESKMALLGTIQFSSSFFHIKNLLKDSFPNLWIPQERPLSPGEILGCTSPKLSKESEILVYLGDGRFHLESAMISNPHLKAYKYDPYSKKLTIENYSHEKMKQIRFEAIQQASKASHWGLILGTLGRQGHPRILKRLQTLCSQQSKLCSIVLLSEIFPAKLQKFSQIGAWVQIACPRLSIDWGYAFSAPLLNPYEAEVALNATEWKEIYPMDYYSKEGGSWTNYYKE